MVDTSQKVAEPKKQKGQSSFLRKRIKGQTQFVTPYMRKAVDEHVLQERWLGGAKEGVVESMDVHDSRSEIVSKEVGCIDGVADKMAIVVACVCVCVCVCVCW